MFEGFFSLADDKKGHFAVHQIEADRNVFQSAYSFLRKEFLPVQVVLPVLQLRLKPRITARHLFCHIIEVSYQPPFQMGV